MKKAPNLMHQGDWDEYQAQVEILRDFHLQSWATFTLGHDFDTIESIERTTAGGSALVLNLAISYGSRDEILGAVRSLARQCVDGEMKPDHITEADFASALHTAGSPDPDLLIRTSGEMRVSNFLLWQIAYSEIHVTPVLWPDYGESDLYEATLEYQRRERRFGRVTG